MSEVRDALREKILVDGQAKFKGKIMPLFGEDVELRTLSVRDILAYQKAADDDSSESLVKMLIDFTFIPGTDEHLFEPEDREAILAMPFTDDVVAFIDAANKMMGVDVEEEVGNSPDTQD